MIFMGQGPGLICPVRVAGNIIALRRSALMCRPAWNNESPSQIACRHRGRARSPGNRKPPCNQSESPTNSPTSATTSAAPCCRRLKKMEDEGHKIIKLNIGNLAAFGFDSPEEIQPT